MTDVKRDPWEAGRLRSSAKAKREAALSAAERQRPPIDADDYCIRRLAYNDARHAAWQQYEAALINIGDDR